MKRAMDRLPSKELMKPLDPDRWRSNDRLRNSKAALWCKACQKVVPVTFLRYLERVAELQCQHTRPLD